ncbi:SulP family inorganic anion transporter [Salsuginibacillus kocurii]|uniref:SulP family inorganic anion transporter n=1 Tax=Salsuginibacillus kocurii TaxID=427078 RepID=UPI0003822D99|nr:sulfate permease [Salsuginibacillus kocurii]
MRNKTAAMLNLPHNYKWLHLKKDLNAGLIIFIMLVPQGMAYAMLAGLPPVMGLYASTIPLIIYALFASSRHLAVGPVAMASILIYSGVSVYAEPTTSEYITLVLLLTLMVGMIQLLLGLMNAGVFIKFISQNVIHGFTSAVAIIIGLSQLGNLLGIELTSQTYIHQIMIDLVQNLSAINGPTLLIGLASLALLIGIKKLDSRLPAPLLVVAGSILVVFLFQLDQVGVNIVGEVPLGLPAFSLPSIDVATVQMLIPTAVTIALIAMMEATAITRTLAGQNNEAIDANKELRALGFSNIVGSMFSAYAVTGSFSRSAVNYQAGAVSQISMLVAGSSVILTLLFFTSFFYYLPQAALAAIIMTAVYGLINVSSLTYAFKVKPMDGWVWLITFSATLIIGIQWGLLIGIAVSMLLLLKRSAKPNIVKLGYDPNSKSYRDLKRVPQAEAVPGTVIIRIDASIHFSNVNYCEKIVAEKINEELSREDKPRLIILDMTGVNDIDTMGIEALERLVLNYEVDDNYAIWLVNIKGPVRDMLLQAGWGQKYPHVGRYLTLDQLVRSERPQHHRADKQELIQNKGEYMI